MNKNELLSKWFVGFVPKMFTSGFFQWSIDGHVYEPSNFDRTKLKFAL
jgi:hypothetical protein